MRKFLLSGGVLAVTVATVATVGLSSSASAYYYYPNYWGGWPNSGIYNTGPWSNNQIFTNNLNNINRTNNNNIGVNNNNVQTAVSGPANVSGNLFGGSAFSGPASNVNNTSTNIGVHNF